MKALVFLLFIAAIGFLGYAYVGPILWRADFAAPTQLTTQTVTLEVE